MPVEGVTPEPGYLVINIDGKRTRYPINLMLRAADIPAGLTYTQVPDITKLANLVMVLVRTLIDKQVLDESFLENNDYSLEAIIESVESMGGSYTDPDIFGS